MSNALGAIYASAVEWPGAALSPESARSATCSEADRLLARTALEAAIGNESDLLALIEPPDNSAPRQSAVAHATGAAN
jgi:hypothetical protein